LKKSSLATLVLVALTLGVLFFMFTVGKTRPPIPADEMHLALGGNLRNCLSCHGPGESQARSQNHPLGRDCLQCHRWAKSR
jgi:hypothetical protein